MKATIKLWAARIEEKIVSKLKKKTSQWYTNICRITNQRQASVHFADILEWKFLICLPPPRPRMLSPDTSATDSFRSGKTHAGYLKPLAEVHQAKDVLGKL